MSMFLRNSARQFVATAILALRFHPTLQLSSSLCSTMSSNHKSEFKESALAKAGLDKNPKQLKPEEWKQILTPQEYYVLREAGTESAFTGKYVDSKDDGSYHCAACGALLFASDAKFSSHCGWPSFSEAVKEAGSSAEANILRKPDFSHGLERIEVVCKQCGSHLGHVFDDGPAPTGERYCINSVSLQFSPKKG